MSNLSCTKIDYNNMKKSLKLFFYHYFFIYIFFSFTKVDKDSLAKKSRENLRRKLVKVMEIFLKKKKNENMVAKDIEISHKEKIKSYLIIKKDILKMKN